MCFDHPTTSRLWLDIIQNSLDNSLNDSDRSLIVWREEIQSRLIIIYYWSGLHQTLSVSKLAYLIDGVSLTYYVADVKLARSRLI